LEESNDRQKRWLDEAESCYTLIKYSEREGDRDLSIGPRSDREEGSERLTH